MGPAMPRGPALPGCPALSSPTAPSKPLSGAGYLELLSSLGADGLLWDEANVPDAKHQVALPQVRGTGAGLPGTGGVLCDVTRGRG